MDNLASVLYSNVMSYYGGNRNEEERKIIEEERKPIREEIIALCEKCLAGCTDDDFIRYSSIQILCSTYISMGETEKAKSYAEKMPTTHYAKEHLIAETLKGTEKFKHIQKQIKNSVFYDILNSLCFLMHADLDDGNKPFNSDECMELYHKMIDIINIFIEKGDFGDFNFRLAPAHQELAILYGQKGDAAAALNHFRLAAKHAVMYDSMPPVNEA